MGYTVLIVDDSATTRAIIKRTIRSAGLPVDRFFEAGDGSAALELLACGTIDLVLADLHMPRMDGVEMTRRLLANPETSSIPVVIISAEPNAERIEQLKREGIRAYLRKPFTAEGIRQVVTDVMGVAHA